MPKKSDKYQRLCDLFCRGRTVCGRCGSAPMRTCRIRRKIARGFGAEGIGLCRTEHMFFAEDRIPIMQKMILARHERGA